MKKLFRLLFIVCSLILFVGCEASVKEEKRMMMLL